MANSQVSVNQTNNTVVVSPEHVSVTARRTPVTVNASGEGPQGPPGPAGPAGEASYEHVQSSPSTSWVITHNLDRYPVPTVFIDGDFTHPVIADYSYASSNQMTITFMAPHSGKAEL